MMKYYLVLLLVFYSGCVQQKNFNAEKTLEEGSINKEFTSSSCTKFSYISTIKNQNYGDLFIEYINLENSCNWNGFQRGYFEYLFKSTLKLKSFRLVESKDYQNYEFNTYIIDEKYYMNLIYKYSIYEDLFIIDYDGKYFTEQIKKFDKDYNNIYMNKERFLSNYKNSLVRMNIINSYFSTQREELNFK